MIKDWKMILTLVIFVLGLYYLSISLMDSIVANYINLGYYNNDIKDRKFIDNLPIEDPGP